MYALIIMVIMMQSRCAGGGVVTRFVGQAGMTKRAGSGNDFRRHLVPEHYTKQHGLAARFRER